MNPQGHFQGGNGVLLLQVQGSEDGHQNGLSLSPSGGSVTVGVFSGDDGRADHPFGMVIVRRHLRVVEKGEQFVLMSLQALDEPKAVGVLIRLSDQGRQALMNELTLLRIDLYGKLGAACCQAGSVLYEASEFLGEAHPLWGAMKDTGTHQVSQEMEETALFEKRPDFVVSAEEIADQDAGKKFPQHFFEDRRGPGGGDEVEGDFRVLAGEAPEPIGFAQHPPSRLIDLEENAGLGQQSQFFIPGGKDLRQAVPSQRQAPWGEREGQAGVKKSDNLAQGESQIEVEIGRLDQEVDPDRAFGEGVFHRGFDGFMALGAVEDLDDMFGNDGLDFRDIFDNTFSGGHWIAQGSGTLRAIGKGMEFGVVDSLRGGPVGSFMARFPAGFFLATLAGRFRVRGLHGRRGRRVVLQRLLSQGLLQFFYPPVQFQELLDGRFFPGVVERSGLFFSQDG